MVISDDKAISACLGENLNLLVTWYTESTVFMILFSNSWKSHSFTGSSTQLFSKYWPTKVCSLSNLFLDSGRITLKRGIEIFYPHPKICLLKIDIFISHGSEHTWSPSLDCVNASVPDTVCRSMSEILQSPVRWLKVADLQKRCQGRNHHK